MLPSGAPTVPYKKERRHEYLIPILQPVFKADMDPSFVAEYLQIWHCQPVSC